MVLPVKRRNSRLCSSRRRRADGASARYELTDGAAMQRHARADAVVQPQGPMFCFDAIEIDDLAIEHCADVAGLVERVDEPLKHDMWRVVAHRG